MKPVLFTTAKYEACATGVLTTKLSIKSILLRLHVSKGREWLCNECLENCEPNRSLAHAVHLFALSTNQVCGPCRQPDAKGRGAGRGYSGGMRWLVSIVWASVSQLLFGPCMIFFLGRDNASDRDGLAAQETRKDQLEKHPTPLPFSLKTYWS
jgi:hypothetical protein